MGKWELLIFQAPIFLERLIQNPLYLPIYTAKLIGGPFLNGIHCFRVETQCKIFGCLLFLRHNWIFQVILRSFFNTLMSSSGCCVPINIILPFFNIICNPLLPEIEYATLRLRCRVLPVIFHRATLIPRPPYSRNG